MAGSAHKGGYTSLLSVIACDVVRMGLSAQSLLCNHESEIGLLGPTDERVDRVTMEHQGF